MERIPIKTILDELNGRQIREDDAERLKDWLAGSGNAGKYDSIRTMWTDARETAKMDFNQRSSKRLLMSRIASSRRPTHILVRAALAASLVALAILIPSTIVKHAKEIPAESVLSEVSSPMGSHTRFRLADGTIVVLNAGSVLTYSSGFNVSDRNVSLEGEGYFEVASNPERPFVVSAGGCTFKVLGTKFNISAYDSESLTTALMEGSLMVSSGMAEDLMAPGEIVSVDADTGAIEKWKGDVSQYNSWVNGFLRFDSISLADLIARLSREYNVSIELNADTLRDRNLRISFNLSEPVGDILESLSSIIPVSVSFGDGKYHICNK